MPNYNLKTLDGIFAYSIISGLMLSVWIYTRTDISETGIAITILNFVSKTLGSQSWYLIPGIAISLTLLEIFILIRNILQIAEHGYGGTIVSGSGFFGSLSVFLGSRFLQPFFIYFGIALWITGIIIIRLSDE